MQADGAAIGGEPEKNKLLYPKVPPLVHRASVNAVVSVQFVSGQRFEEEIQQSFESNVSIILKGGCGAPTSFFPW
jgi:hypothetical protein